MSNPPAENASPYATALNTVTLALSLFDLPDTVSVFEAIRALRTEHAEAHSESLEWYASTPSRFKSRTLESVVSEFQALVGGSPEYLRLYVQMTTDPVPGTTAKPVLPVESAPALLEGTVVTEVTPEPVSDPISDPVSAAPTEPTPEPTPAPVFVVTEEAPSLPEPVLVPALVEEPAPEPAPLSDVPAPMEADPRFQNVNWTAELRGCALDITNMLNELKAMNMTQNAIVREVKPYLGSENSISTGSVGQFMNARYESNGYPVIKLDRLPLYKRAFEQVLDARRRLPTRRVEEPVAAPAEDPARRQALPTSFRDRKATILAHMERELRAGHALTFTYNELGRVLGMSVGTVLNKVLSPMLTDGSLVHKGKEAVSLAPN